MKYPVITLHQPWASFIAEGLKTIETRTHDRFKCLVGKRILIHAGQLHSAKEVWHNFATETVECAVEDKKIYHQIICAATVINARWLTYADSWDAMIDCKNVHRFGLFLTDIKKLDNPVLAKGKQGIWYYEEVL